MKTENLPALDASEDAMILMNGCVKGLVDGTSYSLVLIAIANSMRDDIQPAIDDGAEEFADELEDKAQALEALAHKWAEEGATLLEA